MRLLVLSASGGLGGAERVLIDVVSVVGRRHPDWAVDVLSVEDGPLRALVEAVGATYTVLPLPAGFAATGEYGRPPLATVAQLARSLPGLVRYIGRLRRHLRDLRPDVLHSNGLKAHVLAAWAREGETRVVWHVHDYVGARAISAKLLRLFAGRVSGVIANSESVAADARVIVGLRPPVHVVPNGVDGDRFSVEGPSIDLDGAAGLPQAPADTIRVGLVATYAKWKGHETFLRAVARLGEGRRLRAYVVGGPVYRTGTSQWSRGDLDTLARSLALDGRVGFVDFQADTAPVYRALDVVVHASSQPEPFGLVIAEAMSCGRATVVSRAGGAREIGDEGRTCLMHRPGDVDDLAHAIAVLADDAALRGRLGAAAAIDVRQRYSLERLADRLDAVYAEARS